MQLIWGVSVASKDSYARQTTSIGSGAAAWENQHVWFALLVSRDVFAPVDHYWGHFVTTGGHGFKSQEVLLLTCI
jgi:hypothetical protein